MKRRPFYPMLATIQATSLCQVSGLQVTAEFCFYRRHRY